MKYLIIAFTLLSFQVQAQVITPGLWEVQTEIKYNGEKVNPMSQLQSAMKNMSPEQKKQMMQAMGESGLNIGSSGIKTCITKEMVEKADFKVKEEGDCTTKVVKKTPKQIVSNFTCKDGSSGTSTINIQNKRSYTGEMVMKDSKGKKTDMSFKSKFVSKNCGSVAPVGLKS
ncbi:MAG: DUF3617 domain-containing protein [Bacteriovoracaceae bacterium]|nr:DUF3617 domain-containing protein [Bacteriovoracaceae bacterium]